MSWKIFPNKLFHLIEKTPRKQFLEVKLVYSSLKNFSLLPTFPPPWPLVFLGLKFLFNNFSPLNHHKINDYQPWRYAKERLSKNSFFCFILFILPNLKPHSDCQHQWSNVKKKVFYFLPAAVNLRKIWEWNSSRAELTVRISLHGGVK